MYLKKSKKCKNNKDITNFKKKNGKTMLSLPFFCPPPKPEFLKNSGCGQNRTRALAVTDVHRYPLGQWADARRARERRYISTCQNYITDIRFWLIILVLRPQKNYTNCHNCSPTRFHTRTVHLYSIILYEMYLYRPATPTVLLPTARIWTPREDTDQSSRPAWTKN